MTEMDNKCSFSDKFDQVLPLLVSKGSSKLARVKLSPEGISMSFNVPENMKPKKSVDEDNEITKPKDMYFKVSEIVGCSTQKSSGTSSSAFLKIIIYALDESKKSPRRKRLNLTLEFKNFLTKEENHNEALQWMEFINDLLKPDISFCNNPGMSSEDKLLVLVNPRSGPGRAYQIFRKQVAPVLSDRGVEYDVVITQRANHAHDLMTSLDLRKYRAVAVVAGDGLLYEVYNGLGVRDDWQTALSFPVCIIPGGSGNGLAKSLAFWRKDPEEKKSRARGLIAALNLVRGSPRPMDLVMIHTHSGQRFFSFLSFGMGILTDIDIESERMRFLGEARFTVWAVAKVVATKRYKVTVSFKRAAGVKRDNRSVQRSASQSNLPSQCTSDDARPTLQHSISCHPRHPESPTPSSDGSSSPTHSHPHMPDVELAHDALDEDFWLREKKTSTRKADYSHLLEDGGLGHSDPLSQPIPDDWETVNGEFLLVYVVYQSHISSSVFMVPDAAPDDGVMWLILMQGSMNRADIAKVLLGLESGSYISVPGVRLIPVTELRLVPHDPKALFTIDGESVPYGPVHARVLPGAGRVLVR